MVIITIDIPINLVCIEEDEVVFFALYGSLKGAFLLFNV